MTHIGFLCPTATGHLNSLMPLGQELQRRGHQVTFIQVADGQAKVLAAGLNCLLVGETDLPLGSIAALHAQLAELDGLAATRFSVQWFKKTATVMLDEAPEVIRQAGIEALIVDQVEFEGGTIADRLRLPFITFCSAVLLNREDTIAPFITHWPYNPSWWSRLRNQLGYSLVAQLTQPIFQCINTYRQRWGLPLYHKNADSFSSLAQISQQPAEFEYPRTALPAQFYFTGPHHQITTREPIDFPFDKLTGQPLIYASLGTLQNRQQGVFQTIAQACADLPVQLVLSLGNRDATLPDLPGSPLVVPYAPQLELLQRAALTITHAGLNTTLESLTQGVPLVAIPITNDQPGVASRIAWTGVGEVVPLKQVNVSRLRTAIQKVLIQPSYRQHAMRLQAAIQRSSGVTGAADIVEDVFLPYAGSTQGQLTEVNWASA